MIAVLTSRPRSLGLLVCVLIAAALISNPVWVDTGVMIGIYGLLALSVGISYGQAGVLSLAQAPLAAVGAYATGILSTRYGVPPALGLIVAICLPSLAVSLLARLILNLEPLALALATLALGFLIEFTIRDADGLTGGYLGLAGIPQLGWFDTPRIYLLLTWGCVVVTVFLYENLTYSPWGRALSTIKHDRARASADGVPVVRLLSAAMAFSAALAGLSGWLYAHYVSYLGPTDLGSHLSISVLLMAVIGGLGSVLGPIVGALALSVILRLLPAQEYQGLFYGAVLIVMLLLARRGIMGAVDDLRVRLTQLTVRKAVPSEETARS